MSKKIEIKNFIKNPENKSLEQIAREIYENEGICRACGDVGYLKVNIGMGTPANRACIRCGYIGMDLPGSVISDREYTRLMATVDGFVYLDYGYSRQAILDAMLDIEEEEYSTK